MTLGIIRKFEQKQNKSKTKQRRKTNEKYNNP